jgi:hypothetical protein
MANSHDVKPGANSMNRAQATEIVEWALMQLVQEQSELLALNVTERALSHHLAIYISQRVPGFDTDVEYNRHGPNVKQLSLPPRDALDREIRATTVFPDILVHKRNSNKHNLLVLEVKKPREPIAYDELKLRAFRNELGYLHTGHVILGRGGEGNIVRELLWVDG